MTTPTNEAEALELAERLESSRFSTGNAAHIIEQALAAAEARGREQGLEEAAKVAADPRTYHITNARNHTGAQAAAAIRALSAKAPR